MAMRTRKNVVRTNSTVVQEAIQEDDKELLGCHSMTMTIARVAKIMMLIFPK